MLLRILPRVDVACRTNEVRSLAGAELTASTRVRHLCGTRMYSLPIASLPSLPEHIVPPFPPSNSFVSSCLSIAQYHIPCNHHVIITHRWMRFRAWNVYITRLHENITQRRGCVTVGERATAREAIQVYTTGGHRPGRDESHH